MVPPGLKSTVSVWGAARAASAPKARRREIRAVRIFSEYSFLFLQRSHGRDIRDGKRSEVLVLGDRSEIEAPHLHAESAAARVVSRLRDAVEELRSAVVVDHGERCIPAL